MTVKLEATPEANEAERARAPSWVLGVLLVPLLLSFLAVCAFRVASRRSHDGILLEIVMTFLLPTLLLQAVLLVPFGLRWLRAPAGTRFRALVIAAVGLVLGSLALFLFSLPSEITRLFGHD